MTVNTNPLRILVVDDSALYRKIVEEILSTFPAVKVVGTAENGAAALTKIRLLHPDLLILDVEMPEMNGIEVLTYLMAHKLNVGAIMLSSHTLSNSEMTLKALELGAFDFIPKPVTGDVEQNKQCVTDSLAPMISAFNRRRQLQQMLAGASAVPKRPAETVLRPEGFPTRTVPVTCQAQIIAIGISTGGPQALAQLVRELPSDLGVPILIVQHMPPLFTRTMAERLNNKGPLSVKEAEDNDPIKPNSIYIAPGGRQMKIGSNGRDGKRIIITDDMPENCCKPSVDYLFRSVADLYGCNALGIIMTGMGTDGMLGSRLMKRQGGAIMAQDEESSVVYGMPRGPIEAGIVDFVVPLSRMAATICHIVKTPWPRRQPAPVARSG
jgi:two-component system chemotaxis response regulator CheB